MPAAVQRTMAPGLRRRKAIGQRRRLEDEGDDDGGPDAYDVDDDSPSDGSLISDDNDPADDSDTSNLDDVSPAAGAKAAGNGAAKASRRGNRLSPPTPALTTESHHRIKATKSDTDIARNGMGAADYADQPDEVDFKEVEAAAAAAAAADQPKPTDTLIVSSSSASKPQIQTEATIDRRRREHEEYRRKRDEDPAFVPNRGAFFMHDHRHPGPAANGFRPFARRGRGGRGGIGGPYAPTQMHHPVDPLTTGQWAHDMHETVVDPLPPRPPHRVDNVPPPNGNGYIPTCPNSDTKINREMSCEKVIARVTITVFLPGMESPKTFSGVTQKQYTKLPDHRPPLRRDKPARIFLPGMPEARHVFPATDRSFIFIPRAMRPNQQRGRGKPRGGLGSIGGFSRRTSVFGGSIYGGSIYSPSIAMSRRSSIAPDVGGRDYLLSPTGSTISRPPMPVETNRPVVRLPPQPQGSGVPDQAVSAETSISDLPQPQTHPLPQKPTFDSRSTPIPMHQPRPQKTVSVENIESPTLVQNPEPYQQAFHQQVPVQVSNGYDHSRQPSYPSTGTPLSQIPERAIHAAPFQPNFNQQGYYSHQPSYPMMPPQQQGYYYPPQPYSGPSPSAAPFVPGSQQGQGSGYNPPPEAGVPLQNTQPNTQTTPGSNMVATEINGMVYYYDQSHVPAPMGYHPYPGPQGYPPPGTMPMGGPPPGPNPEVFYYQQQQAPGMTYYSQ